MRLKKRGFRVCLREFFGRNTGSRHWDPVLEGLRGLACGMVFLFHFQTYVTGKELFGGAITEWSFLREWLARGAFGVPLFFLMSGYLFGSTAKRLDSALGIPSFYKARLLRLYPAYAVNICLLWLVEIIQQPAGIRICGWRELCATLGCGSYWISGRPSLINGVAWSLEVELQFYLFAPWLALGLSRLDPSWRLRTLWALTGTGLCFRELLGFTDKTCLGNLHFFLGGWLLFLSKSDCKPKKKSEQFFWDALAAGLLVGMRWIPVDSAGTQVWLFVWASALVSAGFRGQLWRRFLSSSALLAGGVMSYTIYLYHYPILSFFGRNFGPILNPLPDRVALGFFLGSTAIGIPACCAVFYLLFEKPFMGRAKVRHEKAQTAVARASLAPEGD